jgi:hypothetical protein
MENGEAVENQLVYIGPTRLITLIFAGRNRIIMTRRQLPQATDASPAEPVAN